MSAYGKERPPAPLDPVGNEVCLLFLKYGKCRYGKKCKKSHTLPDKNGNFMQQVVPAVREHPTSARTGPKIAFSVRKAPYPRPSRSAATLSVQKSGRIDNVPSQESGQQPLTRNYSENAESMDIDTGDRQSPSTTLTEAVEAKDDQQPKKRRSRSMRSAKALSKCLLASLFRTTIPIETLPKQGAFIPAPFTRGSKAHLSRTKTKSVDKSKTKSISIPHKNPSHEVSVISPNQINADGEKIEQWYITNKAHLEPSTRRLMVLTKPTTLRQKLQLKSMRKHHWECQTQVKGNLKRTLPTTFALKIARSRIDWERVAPYVTLMIQAAFQMDIHHEHLPVIGTTLCTLLEYRELDALQCEELLVSWGLTEVNARRFTSHLWEWMVAAAGEANIRGEKGIGLQVRQYEHRNDFKTIQARLAVLNNAPT